MQSEDEEQGTLKFGKQKEQASYGGMDEEEKAIWKVRNESHGPWRCFDSFWNTSEARYMLPSCCCFDSFQVVV